MASCLADHAAVWNDDRSSLEERVGEEQCREGEGGPLPKGGQARVEVGWGQCG